MEISNQQLKVTLSNKEIRAAIFAFLAKRKEEEGSKLPDGITDEAMKIIICKGPDWDAAMVSIVDINEVDITLEV